MAYVTGSANSISDLLAALQNACTTNGWTLTAGILASGDCHIKAVVSGAALQLTAGTGDDGSGTLSVPSPATYLRAALISEPINYPCTWFAHVTSSEVYFVANFAIDAYIMCGFGQSPVAGLPGTGVWLCGNSQTTGTSLWIVTNNLSGSTYSSCYNAQMASCGMFFSRSANTTYPINHFVHHGLDGAGWSGSYGSSGVWNGIDGTSHATLGAIDLMTRSSPSTWNGEAVLVPVQPIVGRSSGFVSIVADLVNARYVRLDAMASESIVTLGADRWKVYPFYRRNTASRSPNGSSGVTHSGTFGVAIRYDGP